MKIAATRKEAWQQLERFIPRAGRYGRERNEVIPGHKNVSVLSAAVRHRLLTEWEVAQAPRARYAASTIEKFTQEVYWRTYWKGWLSMRPQVWDEYQTGMQGPGDHEKAEKIRSGYGDVEVMNDFARELVTTGYLHNHARMWFAGYWIHLAGLPWEWGARFFEDHLLDFDPASNTLSWRWVAGLQTPGKTYLPRRTNLEKYLHPELLRSGGLELLEAPQARPPEHLVLPAITRVDLAADDPVPHSGGVLWIHEEDLLLENSPLQSMQPEVIVLCPSRRQRSDLQEAWLKQALDDASQRASDHFSCEVTFCHDLLAWTTEQKVTELVTLRPEVGPLRDEVLAMEKAGLVIHSQVRPEDRYLRSFARGGFFPFWEKLKTRLSKNEFPFEREGELKL